MRITLLAIGTRGDIQPLVALGAGLQHTGRHPICFVIGHSREGGTFGSGQAMDSARLGGTPSRRAA